jgi:polyhydroxybutyrate depolymerase
MARHFVEGSRAALVFVLISIGCSAAGNRDQDSDQGLGAAGVAAGTAGVAPIAGAAGVAAGVGAAGQAGVAPLAGAAGASAGTGVPIAGNAGDAGNTGSAGMSAGTSAGTAGTLPDAGSAAGSAGGGGGPEPITCPTGAALEPGDSNHTLDIGGTQRRYIRHVPPGYTGDKPVPLLIDWHPLLSDGDYQRGASGYARVADREGFIVLFPDGIDNAWNIGPCCTFSRDVDDLGFARKMVETLMAEACIDPKRVYSAGFSMGGGMSHYVACEMADVFAAVAPAAFDLLEENTCAPSRPISVLSFRGTSDFIVPYTGGASRPPNGVNTTIHFHGAVGTFEEWGRVNGCTGSPMDMGGGCQTYPACEADVEVTLCTRQGGSHQTGDAERGWMMLSSHAMP